MNQHHPARLIIGSPTAANEHILTHMRANLCNNRGCGTCTTCRQLAHHQHARLLWLQPQQQQYTKQEFAPIAELLALQQNLEQPYYVVITQIDDLSTSCGNSLLKLIEEPPQPYEFLLTTRSVGAVLPTIASRAIHISLQETCSTQHPITQLIVKSSVSHGEFLSILNAQEISDAECSDIIEQTVLQLYAQQRLTHENHKLISQLLAQHRPAGTSHMILKLLFLIAH